MSAGLYWEPVKPKKGVSLPDALKYVLRDKSDRLAGTGEWIADESDVRYFEGLRDAGVEGAEEVLTAIEDNGRIRLYLEF